MRDASYKELKELTNDLVSAIEEKDDAYIGLIILNMLWTVCNENDHPRVFAGGDGEFLFATEEKADAMADIIELATSSAALTGYYDPADDEREGCVDRFTRKWYATWD